MVEEGREGKPADPPDKGLGVEAVLEKADAQRFAAGTGRLEAGRVHRDIDVSVLGHSSPHREDTDSYNVASVLCPAS